MDTIRFNWDKIFLSLSKDRYFLNRRVNETFLENWKQTLQYLENLHCDFDQFESMEIQNYPITFTIIFKDISENLTLEIPILIPPLVECVHESTIKISNVDISIFGDNIPFSADFYLTHENTEPIIMLDEYVLKQIILLDGNHRVKYAKQNNIPTLNAFYISSMFLINRPNLFLNKFHHALYCFLHDLNQFSRCKKSLFHSIYLYEKFFANTHSLVHKVK